MRGGGQRQKQQQLLCFLFFFVVSQLFVFVVALRSDKSREIFARGTHALAKAVPAANMAEEMLIQKFVNVELNKILVVLRTVRGTSDCQLFLSRSCLCFVTSFAASCAIALVFVVR